MNKKDLFIAFQHIAPQHSLSRAAGWLANCTWPWLKNPLINLFAQKYQINWQEAEFEQAEDYLCFNDFFTRPLKSGMRPIDPQANSIASPADGAVSQLGKIEDDRIFQAKGFDFTTEELLADGQLAEPFWGGNFATIYLSPKDYHRVHMPVAGTLTDMIYVPGRLFSVNDDTTNSVPRLFARNERVVCLFDTEFGRMAMVLVGAMIVASVETVWAGQVAPVKRQILKHCYQNQAPIHLEKGAEMGRFKLGSTVVMLFENNNIQFNADMENGSLVTVGSALGQVNG